MTRYRIRLTIGYDYDQPSAQARNLLHLLPSDIPEQQTVSAGNLVIDPVPEERQDRRDFFGNATTSVAFLTPTDKIELSLSALVERSGSAPVLDLSPPLPELSRELAEARDLGPASPHHFLGRSPRIAPEPDMTAFAQGCLRDGMTILEAVRAIGHALHAEMRFDPDATEADTPPGVAFAARHGVCQDFTQIMIACLRGVGIPGGYVSGFLRTTPPPGRPRLEGADAMHAWVRAWCGSENGWVEYDPTNDMDVGADHITVAFGRDYADIAPVRGVVRSAGGHSTEHKVDVIPLD